VENFFQVHSGGTLGRGRERSEAKSPHQSEVFGAEKFEKFGLSQD